ncbi:uncharacterized protein LOC135469027 [Liolophura sinensis]|uniref:uncharacterized protein LOC135469027 n=1 Tax=Liolophura sinensis TaxID=3198878 RepID=UPI00315894D2
MYRTELLLLVSAFISHSYASPFSEDFGTDRALCSYFGCTPDAESTPIPPPNPLLKRPFCNGFRGCANGKRAVVVKTKTTAESGRQDAIRNEKRPFCNGFRGCANGKRSNVLDRDQLWFLQRLLENISRRERRQASLFDSIEEVRRRKRSSELPAEEIQS